MKKYLLIALLMIAACKKDDTAKPSPSAPATGRVLFYSDDYQHRWGIQLDGVDQGSVGQSHTAPECGDTYFQNASLTVGKHDVYVYSMSGLAGGWHDTLSIASGSCTQMNIK